MTRLWLPTPRLRISATRESTGGSSVGTADHTARVIDGLGDPGVIVHGVAIKPGKPLIAGMVKGADAPVPVFGLPGHPVAVIVAPFGSTSKGGR